VSICYALTFESLGLESSFLACRSIFWMSTSSQRPILGMFSMFGRTGGPTKRGPTRGAANFLQHTSEINKSDSDDEKKVASFFSWKIGVTPLGPRWGAHTFFLNRALFRLNPELCPVRISGSSGQGQGHRIEKSVSVYPVGGWFAFGRRAISFIHLSIHPFIYAFIYLSQTPRAIKNVPLCFGL